MGFTIQDGCHNTNENRGRFRMTDEGTDREVALAVTMEMMYGLRGVGERSGALTLAIGYEVVSERGSGAGVTISGAHTVTAQRGAELLHACQSLCREGVGRGTKPQHRAAEVVNVRRR